MIRHTRFTLVVSACLSAITVPLLADERSDPEAEKRVDAIPVVKTWEELEARPRIRLPNGVTVRLGIDRDRAPRNGGCLVYCLAENWPPAGSFEASEDQFGPVRLVAREQRGLQRIRERMRMQVAMTRGRDGEAALFVRSIPITRSETYDIRVLTMDDHPLASTTVRGLEEAIHPWLPFSRADDHQVFDVLSVEGAPQVDYVTTAPAGIAIPSWEPFHPLYRPRKTADENGGSKDDSTESRTDGTPLPRLFPEKVDPGVRLRLRGRVFEIEFGELRDLDPAHDRFLARWWVNGAPFEPQPDPENIEAERDAARKLVLTKELHLHVSFDAERFGAKSGDRIGVQLLYCPGGWDRVWGQQLDHLRLPELAGDHPALTRMSNRVVFTVP